MSRAFKFLIVVNRLILAGGMVFAASGSADGIQGRVSRDQVRRFTEVCLGRWKQTPSSRIKASLYSTSPREPVVRSGRIPSNINNISSRSPDVRGDRPAISGRIKPWRQSVDSTRSSMPRPWRGLGTPSHLNNICTAPRRRGAGRHGIARRPNLRPACCFLTLTLSPCK